MFDHELQTLLDAGLAGWLLLLSLASAEIIALAALPIAATATPGASSNPLRRLAAAGAAALAIGLLSAYRIVREAQTSTLTLPPALSPESWPPWMAGMQRAETAHGLLGLALLPIALLAGVTTVLFHYRLRSAGSPSPARSLAPWLAASAALIATACSIGLLRRMHAGTVNLGCAIAVLCEASWLEKEATAILAQTRLHVLGVAALGTAALGVVALLDRSAPRRPRTGLAAATGLFIIGLASFLGTRAMAHDARAPLPRPESGAKQCPPLSYGSAHLPRTGKCDRCARMQDNASGPVLELGEDGPRLDGARVSGPAEAAALLKNRATEWRARETPHRPPPVMLSISPEMRREDFAPYLLAVRDAYTWEMAILTAQQPAHVETKTLGKVPLGPRCCCDQARFSRDGVPLIDMPLWRDLAEAAARSDDILYIALP